MLNDIDRVKNELELSVIGSVDDDSLIDQVAIDEHAEGYLPRKEYLERLSESDISIIPSYHENFSLTALESMARGNVVITTATCGIAHIPQIRDLDGVIVVTDGEEILRKIEALSEESADSIADRQESCFNFAQSLTWKSIADWYLKISNHSATLECDSPVEKFDTSEVDV